jgi:putative endonuclease
MATKRQSAQESGKTGEEIAQAYLEQHGYTLIDVNVRFGRTSGVAGELDIVAWEGETLCFIEVKTRQETGADDVPAAAVTVTKQRQLTRLATRYAIQNSLLGDGETPMRFDVVAVVLPSSVRRKDFPDIRLIRGAFDAVSE